MTHLRTKPRSGRLIDPEVYTGLMGNCLRVARAYDTVLDFCRARGIRLANHQRSYVSLMRVPYSPYYDTSFILKLFKTANRAMAPVEQVELEAASLHHAGEAFRRNNNVCRAPRVYAIRPRTNLITMEHIRSKGVRESNRDWWSKERMIRFVRQMAVVRLAILTQVENQLGVPRHAPQGGRVGPYCSWLWWEKDRYRFFNQIYRGPFPNRHELILASLRRDLAVTRWQALTGKPVPERSHYHRWEEIIVYLETTLANIDQEPRPTHREYFSLNHNDLRLGFNALVRGTKLVGIIDWEVASYDPLPMCIVDLTNEMDFDPKVWREHAGPNGENFHLLPYRLERDPTEGRMAHATALGTERRPFPDWELIENNGGPLGEEDFCGDYYPEDISSDGGESIVDAAEMHCDSDADAGEACVMPMAGSPEPYEQVRVGLVAPDLGDAWYYQPVYSLMKEFIHHQRGVGLGPDGEWGKLPEEYSRPLADWEDPLYWRVTQNPFEARHVQLVDEDRVEVIAAKAATVAAKYIKAGKNPPKKVYKLREKRAPVRKRRVPTLLDGWHDASTTEAQTVPESPVWSSGSAFLTRNLPGPRTRRDSPPIRRKVGQNQSPTPPHRPRRAPAPTEAERRTEVGNPPVEATPPNDDVRVNSVRDAILSKVLERLEVIQH